jgi:hypothetical protein
MQALSHCLATGDSTTLGLMQEYHGFPRIIKGFAALSKRNLAVIFDGDNGAAR